ncbi:creatininase family protein [Tropicibacter sp. Alg240-R139]|uniref:creatininase family protein n=1 Tax=Tropicibacter sp. Alg240-R139 TaxID=2305991 RepID=UPI0013DF42AB|nr:creatininase family protein [Tropicibacter sp. Alg240-R139]
MQLSDMTWPDVGKRIERGACVMLPVGSTEQHGPMGRIGTDTICADAIAQRAAKLCDAIVAPALAYTPAPFNTGFPGTVSVSEGVFAAHAGEVIRGLLAQGFDGVFVVNGHGANIAPLRQIADTLESGALTLLSWWEPQEVNALRQELYGAWEGMHATPSEIAITQALIGVLPANGAENPPEALSAEYINAHRGDKHGPPDEHRAMFPDGRVGSHSVLARPDHGERLLQLAAQGVADAFVSYSEGQMNLKREQ